MKPSPQAEAELNGLCPDDVGNDGNVTKFIILHKIQISFTARPRGPICDGAARRRRHLKSKEGLRKAYPFAKNLIRNGIIHVKLGKINVFMHKKNNGTYF